MDDANQPSEPIDSTPQRIRCACDPTRTFVNEETYWLHRKRKHGDQLPAHIVVQIDARGGGRPAENPRAERVPIAAEGLPWIKYPRDADLCGSIVARIDGMLENLGPNELAFWRSVRNVVASLKDRLTA